MQLNKKYSIIEADENVVSCRHVVTNQSISESITNDKEMNMNVSWQSIQWLWRHFSNNQKCQPHGGDKGKATKVIRIDSPGKFHGNLFPRDWHFHSFTAMPLVWLQKNSKLTVVNITWKTYILQDAVLPNSYSIIWLFDLVHFRTLNRPLTTDILDLDHRRNTVTSFCTKSLSIH